MTATDSHTTSSPTINPPTNHMAPSRPLDPDKLMSFVFRAVSEVGATLNTALVVMGDELGYYRAMADGDALTPAELAERTSTSEPGLPLV